MRDHGYICNCGLRFHSPEGRTVHQSVCRIELLIKQARQVGIKEVVDWIQQNHQYVGLCHPDAFADWIQVEMDKWQAKLKEWGINP